MRLNNDCIRDILIFIEDKTDYTHRSISAKTMLDNLDYDENTLFYHINMIFQAKLVDNVTYGGNKPLLISNLSWEGHQYIDNIRDDKVWKTVKDKASTLSSVSLKVLIPIASKIIENMLLH